MSVQTCQLCGAERDEEALTQEWDGDILICCLDIDDCRRKRSCRG